MCMECLYMVPREREDGRSKVFRKGEGIEQCMVEALALAKDQELITTAGKAECGQS